MRTDAPADDGNMAQDFVNDASVQNVVKPAAGGGRKKGARPWEMKDDKRKSMPFGLRLTDADHAKLTWIAEQTGSRSMQQFAYRALMDAIEREIKRIENGAGA